MIDITQILLLLCISLALFACFISGFGVYYALKAWISVSALEKSTHTITYAPVDKEIDKANAEWASSQESLNKQNKAYSEDIEETMPEFSLDDDDQKIYSF